MNILLLSCPNKQSEKTYPIHLGIISSILKQKRHAVFGADLSFMSIKECIRLINKKKINIIGVFMSYYEHEQACKAVNSIASSVSLPIIALGTNPTIRGEELMREDCLGIDYLIKGEPERPFIDFVETMAHDRDVHEVAGLIWRNGRDIAHNGERECLDDLDGLPFPDRTLFPMGRYSGMICKNKQYTQIITSRGCPHACTYCFQNVNEPQPRQRTPKNVVDEIEYLIRDFNIKEMHIEDSNFVSGNCERVKEICREILKRKLNVDWQCSGVIPISEITDMEMLSLMAKAGCYNISLGIESFDQSVTASVGRNQSTKALPNIIQCCHEYNMEVSCHMMIGFPGQSRNQLYEDIRISRTYPFDFIHYNIFQKFPDIADNDWSKTNCTVPAPDDSNIISVSELNNIRRSAYYALIFKQSVLKFVLKRLLKIHNTMPMFRKIVYYIFGTHNFYLVR